MKRTKRNITTTSIILLSFTFPLFTNAQCDGNVLDNLTGGSSLHSSTISSGWSKHEWNITFPSQYWNLTIKDVKLWYRLYSTGTVTVNGGFADGNDGAPVVTFVNATTQNNVTPPNTTQTDNYLVFDFTGQYLTIPSNGILWFRFNWVSGINNRKDVGSNTYTSTYEQNDNVRPGFASFAIYANIGFSTSQTVLNTLCNGDSSGQATVSVTGNNPPFSFQWDSNANNQTDSTATGLSAGTYLVTITDSLGCQDVDTVVVTEPSAITTSTSVVNVLCNGDSTGTASVQAGGGTPGYTYVWNDVNNQTDSTATGLTAGTYYVTVTDNNGCTHVDTATVDESPALTLNITANDDVDQSCVGNATAIPGNGVPPYTYQWDANTGNQTLQTATALCAGTYFVTITDNNGCMISDSAVIGNVSGINNQQEQAAIKIYPNPNNGNFNIQLAGEAGNVGLVIYNSIGEKVLEKTLLTETGVTKFSFDNFTPGIYYLQFNMHEQQFSKKITINK